MFLNTNNKLSKQKQIVVKVIFTILTISVLMFVFFSIKKRDELKPVDNQQDYIVTEYFIEKNNDNSTFYETRYYLDTKKTVLILINKEGKEIEEIVTETESKFIHEFIDFAVNSKKSSDVVDLSPYVDESGFIYNCQLDKIEEFLANEGNIRLANGTPSYFECYIEDNEGKINRGLVLYNSDLKTGTFIYKQCAEGIGIPTVTDLVDIIEKNK